MEREALKLALGFIEDVHFGEWQGSTERKEEVVTAIKKALAQPALEQNFCPRCGKRTKDIHTCTPPQETALEKI